MYVLESYTLYVCDYKNNRQGLLLLLSRVYESIKFCKSEYKASYQEHPHELQIKLLFSDYCIINDK